MYFNEITPNTPLMLHIYKESKQLNLKVHLQRHLDSTTAIISLQYEGDHVLTFSGVAIDLEFGLEQAAPYIWKNSRVVYHKGHYILKVATEEGIKTNRRDSFRVSIGISARTSNENLGSVMVRDISHSGFALTAKKRGFVLPMGETVFLTFEDKSFRIRLEGVLVRIEEREVHIIYGFKSTVFCPTLPQYIAFKQRPQTGKIAYRR